MSTTPAKPMTLCERLFIVAGMLGVIGAYEHSWISDAIENEATIRAGLHSYRNLASSTFYVCASWGMWLASSILLAFAVVGALKGPKSSNSNH